MGKPITQSERGIDDDCRGISSSRRPVRHDPYPKTNLPDEVKSKLKPNDRVLIDSAYREPTPGDKSIKGYNQYTIYDENDYIASTYTEPTVDDIGFVQSKKPAITESDRGVANKGVEPNLEDDLPLKAKPLSKKRRRDKRKKQVDDIRECEVSIEIGNKTIKKTCPSSGDVEAGHKSFIKILEEDKLNQRREMIRRLHFDPIVLPRAYLASIQRAMSIENQFIRMGTFERLTTAFYVGSKVSKNWYKYEKEYGFSGEETLYEFSRRLSNKFLREDYFPGFVSSFGMSFTDEQIDRMLDYTLEYFDPSSLNSPLEGDARKVVKKAYRLIEESGADWRGWFKSWLTISSSVGDLDPLVEQKLKEKYPRLYEQAKSKGFVKYFRSGEL